MTIVTSNMRVPPLPRRYLYAMREGIRVCEEGYRRRGGEREWDREGVGRGKEGCTSIMGRTDLEVLKELYR